MSNQIEQDAHLGVGGSLRMPSRKKVDADVLDGLPDDVEALPPYRPQKITPKEAVRRALPQIHAMQKKGYTHAAIADFLSSRGLEVTALSLKRYMALVGPAGGKRPRNAAPRDGSAVVPKATGATAETKRQVSKNARSSSAET